jgi:hypothetical protein
MEVSQNDRIAQDAREYCKGVGNSFKAHVMTNAYVAGATAEHERAQEELKRANDAAIMFCNRYNVVAEQLAEAVDRAKVLVDALEFVKNNGLCSETTEVINKALEQWEGKEVKPEHYVSIG